MDFEIVKMIKEQTCFMSQDYSADVAKFNNLKEPSNELDKHVRLPDGRRITLGKERFMVPEMLMNPDTAGPQYTHFDSLPKMLL